MRTRTSSLTSGYGRPLGETACVKRTVAARGCDRVRLMHDRAGSGRIGARGGLTSTGGARYGGHGSGTGRAERHHVRPAGAAFRANLGKPGETFDKSVINV